jgi:hypothetical protein
MLRPGKHCFVLKHQWNRKQQLEPPIQGSQQKLAGSASVASQGRNDYVRIEHIRNGHWLMILHAISPFQVISVIPTGVGF